MSVGPGGNEDVGLLLRIKNDKKAKQSIILYEPFGAWGPERLHSPTPPKPVPNGHPHEASGKRSPRP